MPTIAKQIAVFAIQGSSLDQGLSWGPPDDGSNRFEFVPMKVMHSRAANLPLPRLRKGERSPARERGRVRGLGSIRYIVTPSPQLFPFFGEREHAEFAAHCGSTSAKRHKCIRYREACEGKSEMAVEAILKATRR
jgi:hypothetical protein